MHRLPGCAVGCLEALSGMLSRPPGGALTVRAPTCAKFSPTSLSPRAPQVVSDPQQLSQLLQAVQASQKLSLATSDALSCSTRAVDGAAQPQASAAGAAAGSEHLGEAERGVAAAGAGELDCAAPAAPPTRRLRLRRELAVLFWRTATDTWRNPSLLLMHWALALGMGLLMGVIFYDQGKDMSGIQNRGGACAQQSPRCPCVAGYRCSCSPVTPAGCAPACRRSHLLQPGLLCLHEPHHHRHIDGGAAAGRAGGAG